MLIQRTTLLCIFGIFHVFFMDSIGFAQSDQNTDSDLSTSQYIKLMTEIHALDTKMAERISAQNTKIAEDMGKLETKMRDHVDVKLKEVTDDLDELQEDVAFMKGMFTTIQGITTIFGGPLLVGIAVGMILNHFQNRRNKTNTDIKNVDKKPADSDIMIKEPEALDILKRL